MREDYWWEWGRGCEGGRTTGGNGGEGVSEGGLLVGMGERV